MTLSIKLCSRKEKKNATNYLVIYIVSTNSKYYTQRWKRQTMLYTSNRKKEKPELWRYNITFFEFGFAISFVQYLKTISKKIYSTIIQIAVAHHFPNYRTDSISLNRFGNLWDTCKYAPYNMLLDWRHSVICWHTCWKKHLSHSFSFDYGKNDTWCTLKYHGKIEY
jgi:hypothetical protein